MLNLDPRIAFFDQAAASWDTAGPPHTAILSRLAGLAPELGLAHGQAVLELGCGTGQVTAWLTAQVAPGEVTAVDFAPEMLARARERGGAAQYLCADVCIADIGVARYDVAFCLHVWPHIRARGAALANLRRSLRPSGRLILLHCDSRENINAFHAGLPGPVRHDLLPDEPVVRGELAAAGFTVQTWRESEDLYLVIARALPMS